jgi:5-methyltetrahydrofolate--homocysteine methyltransferase
MSTLNQLSEAIKAGDNDAALKHAEEALQSGISAKQVLDEGLIAAMDEVGRLFRDGEYFLPEVLVAADAMKAAMEILEPRLRAEDVKPEAIAVVGTVQGDLHDIGKNLVAVMLQGAGFEVIDLGVDVSPEQFIAACREHKADILGLSALLTTTMPAMKAIIEKATAELSPRPRILIGGAPVTQDYANEIGADGYAPDAASGAQLAKSVGKP